MSNSESLKKNNDFRRVYGRGKSIANRQLVMYYMPNRLGKNRIGISVSKKIGNSVVRSRVTRLIRESYRLNEHKVLIGYDVIIIARTGINGLKCQDVQKSVLHLFNKLNLLKPKPKNDN